MEKLSSDPETDPQNLHALDKPQSFVTVNKKEAEGTNVDDAANLEELKVDTNQDQKDSLSLNSVKTTSKKYSHTYLQ